ncbi:MAG: DUF502 domain-containing protein [Legionellaceae bacterium]|nr:DUF502 domain-containing protein [Legionellaceae bacterium]MBP9776024.1 DUF502 domain-containing protein [Legionellaceae bacterium]
MWILQFIVELLDSSVALLPDTYQPSNLLGINLPGLGVLFSLVVLLLTGVLVTNYLGQLLVGWSERFLDKIPLVRSIYNTAKQVIQAIFSSNSNAFRKVVLVEYPRKDIWTLAFQTANSVPFFDKDTENEMISIFVPTTPNPTGGFLLMVARNQIKEINITVDEALKYIISLGVMQQKPDAKLPKA